VPQKFFLTITTTHLQCLDALCSACVICIMLSYLSSSFDCELFKCRNYLCIAISVVTKIYQSFTNIDSINGFSQKHKFKSRLSLIFRNVITFFLKKKKDLKHFQSSACVYEDNIAMIQCREIMKLMYHSSSLWTEDDSHATFM
jgi:hypothetical protein